MLLLESLLNDIVIRVICEATGSERLSTTCLDRCQFLLLLYHRKRDICIVNLLQLLLRCGRFARICRILRPTASDTVVTAHDRRELLSLL